MWECCVTVCDCWRAYPPKGLLSRGSLWVAAFSNCRKLSDVISQIATARRTTMKAFPQTGKGAERSEADEGDGENHPIKSFIFLKQRCLQMT